MTPDPLDEALRREFAHTFVAYDAARAERMLADVHAAAELGRRRWSAPIAAAAAVLIVGGGAAALGLHGSDGTERPGGGAVTVPPSTSVPAAPTPTDVPTPTRSLPEVPPPLPSCDGRSAGTYTPGPSRAPLLCGTPSDAPSTPPVSSTPTGTPSRVYVPPPPLPTCVSTSTSPGFAAPTGSNGPYVGCEFDPDPVTATP